ncbi:Hypothetical predicted protein [Podarcis lilfordi]|uniref:Uncharacterized protein n=1 Tax=Podarcis lilfordi TaxID=74358 RepID=A0AA35PUP4_9SAUR|nr:Hypothetical predicted protein [Podarcis lilfordi]
MTPCMAAFLRVHGNEARFKGKENGNENSVDIGSDAVWYLIWNSHGGHTASGTLAESVTVLTIRLDLRRDTLIHQKIKAFLCSPRDE